MDIHPNLRPFAPGQSGNPSGRPRGSVSLVTILRRKLAEGDDAAASEIVDAMISEAKAGDFRHAKEILDRIDGKVPDKVQVTNVPPEIDDAAMAAAETKLKQWRDKMRAEIPDTPPSSPLAPPTPPISSMNSAS